MENTSSENRSSSTFLKQWISTSMDLSQNSSDVANLLSHINTIQTESIHAISQDHNFNSLKISALQNQPECIDIDEESEDHNDDSLNVNHVKTIDGQPECIGIDQETQDHIVIENITSLTVDEADGKATADTSMEIENSSQNEEISEEVHMDVETSQNGEANVLQSSQNEDTESEKQIQIVNYSSNTSLMEKEVETHPNETFEEMVDVESMDYVESAGENDAVKKTADSLQANESEAVHDNEIEIIQEKSRNVVVDNISICSSDSSDGEFASTIGNIVSEAFKNDDSQSEKIPDTTKGTDVPPQNMAVNTTATVHEIVLSDDEDFDKEIEDAVQEVFTGNDGTSEKNNETLNKDTPSNTAIDEHSSASQDETAYEFLRKKIKLEKEVTSSTEREDLENFDGQHSFTITVSFIDNKDSVNHAVYSESRNKLYVNKDYEFQVLCSSISVPPNSFLKACVYFDDPSQYNFIVKRCAVHYRSERSNGNRMHVIRTTHPEARYEKDLDSERYYVAIPYQSSLKSSQGGAELYCYTYKFACYSSCYGVKQRNFKVKFTLENGEKQLGRQVIDVKVCKYPEKEMSAEEKKPEEEKIPEETTSEVEEEADSEEECPSEPENGNVPRRSFKKSSGVILLIKHFLIPALNSEKYGRLLFWGDQPNVFFIKWKHKARTTWSEDELAVFKDWDDLKGRSENVFDDQEMVNSKQRLRAAFRGQKKLVEMESEVEEYKKYKILSSTYLKVRRSQRDRAAMPDGKIQRDRTALPVGKIPSPNKSLPESRNISVRAHEKVSYEETADFDEDGKDEIPVREPPKKKLKTNPPAQKPYFRKNMRFRQNPKKKSSVRAKPGPKPKLHAKPGPKPKLHAANATESSSFAVSGIHKLGDGFKKGNLLFEARVELERLTVQDLLKAKVKRKVIEKYYGKIKSPAKPRSRAQPDKIKVDYSPKINLESSNVVPPVPPTSQTVFQNQAINFQATPYQVPAVPPLMSMPMMERKDDEKPKLLNTYNNIKTQGDMIEAMIKAALPTLQGDKVSEIYNFLVEMGVENVEDLAFIEVDDMNRILKPVQSRKLIAAWKNKGVSSYGSNQTSV
ncbi:hypothetical protein JTE90_026788 [Oedothorax gibbosus]|uniref:IRF tryptophan pentad repeat domain-containing protein n=1 Tax=Oedothorax gibbosus TaxID=931172 RepID=A0AAV6URJ5_9ARAC|nr:hypothetical protein JTE90_026788 [Oedothorax gibbosus]